MSNKIFKIRIIDSFMNEKILKNPNIKTVDKEALDSLEISLSEFEILTKRQTPMKNIAGLINEANLTAEKLGADLLVLSNERIYNRTFANKHQYDFEFYKRK